MTEMPKGIVDETCLLRLLRVERAINSAVKCCNRPVLILHIPVKLL